MLNSNNYHFLSSPPSSFFIAHYLLTLCRIQTLFSLHVTVNGFQHNVFPASCDDTGFGKHAFYGRSLRLNSPAVLLPFEDLSSEWFLRLLVKGVLRPSIKMVGHVTFCTQIPLSCSKNDYAIRMFFYIIVHDIISTCSFFHV
jgi:hypothetical protein